MRKILLSILLLVLVIQFPVYAVTAYDEYGNPYEAYVESEQFTNTEHQNPDRTTRAIENYTTTTKVSTAPTTVPTTVATTEVESYYDDDGNLIVPTTTTTTTIIHDQIVVDEKIQDEIKKEQNKNNMKITMNVIFIAIGLVLVVFIIYALFKFATANN